MPEDEKMKLIKLYDNIKLDEKLISDLVIINKKDKFENFKIHNTKYNLVYSSNVYDIFQINWLFFNNNKKWFSKKPESYQIKNFWYPDHWVPKVNFFFKIFFIVWD